MLLLSISRHTRAGWQTSRPKHPQHFVHIFDICFSLHIFGLLFVHSSTYSQSEGDNFLMPSFPGWQPVTGIGNSLTKPDTFWFISASQWAYHFSLFKISFPIAIFSLCTLCSLSHTNITGSQTIYSSLHCLTPWPPSFLSSALSSCVYSCGVINLFLQLKDYW